MKKTNLQLIALILALGFTGNLASAQIPVDVLSLSSSPGSPSPGETFRVRASTPTFDKDSANFRWRVDGVIKGDLSGIGKNSISLTAGPTGSLTRVDVNVVRLDEAGVMTDSITVRVSDLTLVPFAQTYTPRWYRGAALPVENSVVKIVAVPNVIIGGVGVEKSGLVFRWSLDDEDNVLTGAGEDVFSIRTSVLPKSSHHVGLVVEDLQKRIRKNGEIFIVNLAPKALIYASTPLGGVEARKSVSSFSVTERGLLDFVVEPFFFPVVSKALLSYRWTIGGQNAGGSPDKPFILTLNTEDQGPGEFPVGVTINSKDIISSVSGFFNLSLK